MHAVFAGMALLLASIGIYGVLAYLTGQRTSEIGIRMASGANVRDIMRLVLWQGLKMTIAGVSIGIAASFAAGQALVSCF
jgi:ABC-type antimicrobial peptide transport system permease subunit